MQRLSGWDSVTQKIMPTADKWNFHEIKSFCTAKEKAGRAHTE